MHPSVPDARGRGGIATIRESVLTGLAIVVPGLITVYVLQLGIEFLLRGLAPWLRLAIALWPGVVATPLLVTALALGLLATLTTLLGFVVRFHAGEAAVRAVDGAIARVPGVGTFYGSVSRVMDSVLVGDSHSFQDVKLVESPSADHYMLGFLVAESPTAVQGALGPDVRTLFVPLAPNPVMAGYVVHADEEQLREVDMTVQEGISAIVSLGATEDAATTGAATGYRAGYRTS